VGSQPTRDKSVLSQRRKRSPRRQGYDVLPFAIPFDFAQSRLGVPFGCRSEPALSDSRMGQALARDTAFEDPREVARLRERILNT